MDILTFLDFNTEMIRLFQSFQTIYFTKSGRTDKNDIVECFLIVPNHIRNQHSEFENIEAILFAF